jgi:hypothetical protein
MLICQKSSKALITQQEKIRQPKKNGFFSLFNKTDRMAVVSSKKRSDT